MFIVHWVYVYSFFLDPKVNKDMNLTEPHIFLETFDSLWYFDFGITSGAFVFIPGCISFITKIEFNKRFAILQATLYKAGRNLGLFVMIFGIILLGFQ